MFKSMILMAGSLSSAVSLSQFPEFSQQYLQRLAGQADALRVVIADFDRSAAANDLTREAALAQLQGTAFASAHQTDMRATFARAERLEANLTVMRLSSPLERMAMPQRFDDPETLQATWADFRPAVPVTPDGAISAGIGFGAGWLVLGALLSLLTRPFRRRNHA